MEKYKILFSPIGKNDPISTYRIAEGSFLQLVRYLKPDKIYMFLTDEISGNEKEDLRNEKTLKRVCDEIGINPDYEIIGDTVSKEESHKFDVFYKQFENKLNNIREKYPDADIYLNVSSGTPAIKSALNIIAGIDNKYIALQVEDPGYDKTRKNIFKATEEEKKKIEELEKDGVALYDYLWEINRDRTDAFFFRVKPSENLNFISKIKKEMIKEHLDRYNYNAASIIVEGINNKDNEYMVSSDAKKLIKAAEKRLLLDNKGFKKLLSTVKSNKKDLIENKKSKKDTEIYEYIMTLEIKLKKREYADFIRAISPVLTDLFSEYLRRKLNIDIYEDYCEKINGIYKLDEKKLNATDIGKRIIRALTEEHEKFIFGNVYASTLMPIIIEFSDSKEIVDAVKKLRFLEKKLRNIAAHEMISIDEQKIVDIFNDYNPVYKGYSNMSTIRLNKKENIDIKSPYDIIDMLKLIAEKINVASPDEWDAYEKMNTIIKELL